MANKMHGIHTRAEFETHNCVYSSRYTGPKRMCKIVYTHYATYIRLHIGVYVCLCECITCGVVVLQHVRIRHDWNVELQRTYMATEMGTTCALLAHAIHTK